MDEKARTIFVGNAPLSSTRKEIKKLFSKFGVVESVRLRSVIAADEGNSKKVSVYFCKAAIFVVFEEAYFGTCAILLVLSR